MPLSFGVTVLPDPPASRLVELMQLGEQNGFEIGWTYDSHVLWQESFIQLTLAIQATTTMKFGHLVTNPGTREPTVLASLYATMHDISDGRMVMDIGRGDSARRYIGVLHRRDRTLSPAAQALVEQLETAMAHIQQRLLPLPPIAADA